MADKIEEKTKKEPVATKVKRRQKALERLGFVQMMFDFYTTPVV